MSEIQVAGMVRNRPRITLPISRPSLREGTCRRGAKADNCFRPAPQLHQSLESPVGFMPLSLKPSAHTTCPLTSSANDRSANQGQTRTSTTDGRPPSLKRPNRSATTLVLRQSSIDGSAVWRPTVGREGGVGRHAPNKTVEGGVGRHAPNYTREGGVGRPAPNNTSSGDGEVVGLNSRDDQAATRPARPRRAIVRPRVYNQGRNRAKPQVLTLQPYRLSDCTFLDEGFAERGNPLHFIGREGARSAGASRGESRPTSNLSIPPENNASFFLFHAWPPRRPLIALIWAVGRGCATG
jgi:hypothetical protein